MEFSHPCFQKGHPYLLEHIKRKITHPKAQQQDTKSTVRAEAVNKVLSEVKTMRGRQDALDSRFSSMRQENEALWRELSILRQKHMKQQQIVNKVRKISLFFIKIIFLNPNFFAVDSISCYNGSTIEGWNWWCWQWTKAPFSIDDK